MGSDWGTWRHCGEWRKGEETSGDSKQGFGLGAGELTSLAQPCHSFCPVSWESQFPCLEFLHLRAVLVYGVTSKDTLGFNSLGFCYLNNQEEKMGSKLLVVGRAISEGGERAL